MPNIKEIGKTFFRQKSVFYKYFPKINPTKVAARVLKDVSRSARADKTLLEERRERLKLAQNEIKRAERDIKEGGEKAALKVLNRCGDENGRPVRERFVFLKKIF